MKEWLCRMPELNNKSNQINQSITTQNGQRLHIQHLQCDLDILMRWTMQYQVEKYVTLRCNRSHTPHKTIYHALVTSCGSACLASLAVQLT